MHSLEIRRRVDGVKRHWSGLERRQRAELGRRRAADFISTIVERDPNEDAIWAVESLTPDDIERLHGSML